MQQLPPIQKKPWYRWPIFLFGILALCLCTVSCGGQAQPPTTFTGPLSTAPRVQRTPTARVVPTTKPTATPAPRPTVNVITHPPALLSLTFTQAINERVSVHTLPGASLTINVMYVCSRHDATSQSLQGTFYADGSGNHTWTWTNQSSCHGAVVAMVTSSSGGKTVISSASFSD